MVIWSGRTEWNCHHEFPGLGCLRYTTPRNESGAPGETRTHNPCLRGRCLDPIWLLTRGGTERTRTVIDLIDNKVPHLSATVPREKWHRVSGFNRPSQARYPHTG